METNQSTDLNKRQDLRIKEIHKKLKRTGKSNRLQKCLKGLHVYRNWGTQQKPKFACKFCKTPLKLNPPKAKKF